MKNKEKETITLYAGGEAVEVKILASFTLDERDYCWLEDPETKDPVLFRYYSDKEDMVFQLVEDAKEYEEANEAYQDILKDRKDDRARNTRKGMEIDNEQ